MKRAWFIQYLGDYCAGRIPPAFYFFKSGAIKRAKDAGLYRIKNLGDSEREFWDKKVIDNGSETVTRFIISSIEIRE